MAKKLAQTLKNFRTLAEVLDGRHTRRLLESSLLAERWLPASSVSDFPSCGFEVY
jgi:hypothetical protein